MYSLIRKQFAAKGHALCVGSIKMKASFHRWVLNKSDCMQAVEHRLSFWSELHSLEYSKKNVEHGSVFWILEVGGRYTRRAFLCPYLCCFLLNGSYINRSWAHLVFRLTNKLKCFPTSTMRTIFFQGEAEISANLLRFIEMTLLRQI